MTDSEHADTPIPNRMPSPPMEGLPSLQGPKRRGASLLAWTFILGAVSVFLLLLYMFSGQISQTANIFQPPHFHYILVDDALSAKLSFPDLVEGTVQVPAGLPASVKCEATMSRTPASWTLRVGDRVETKTTCDFTLTAPSVPGEVMPFEVELLDRESGLKMHSQKLALAAVPAEDTLQLTHVVPFGTEGTPGVETGLNAAHRSSVLGKLFVLEAPPAKDDLRVLVFVGRVDEAMRLQAAVDMEAMSKGELVAIQTPLTEYRGFGQKGKGYFFQSPTAVWIGDAKDRGVVFRLVTAVFTKSEAETFLRRHLNLVLIGDGPKKRARLEVRPASIEELRKVAFRGLVSSDLHLVRAAAETTELPDVTWEPSVLAAPVPAVVP